MLGLRETLGAEPTVSAPTASTEVVSSEPGAETSLELQVRALERACNEVDCTGRTLLVLDSISDELRAAISARFDDVEFPPLEQLNGRASEEPDTVRAITPTTGRLAKEDPAVWAVLVSLWTPNEYRGQEYLFRNDAGRWVDVSPEQAGVTVTMMIS